MENLLKLLRAFYDSSDDFNLRFNCDGGALHIQHTGWGVVLGKREPKAGKQDFPPAWPTLPRKIAFKGAH